MVMERAVDGSDRNARCCLRLILKTFALPVPILAVGALRVSGIHANVQYHNLVEKGRLPISSLELLTTY